MNYTCLCVLHFALGTVEPIEVLLRSKYFISQVKRRVIKTGDGTHYALGNEQDRNAVTAIGILHPLNPSYNVVYSPPEAVLEDKGLPLYHENDVFDPSVASRLTGSA